MVNKPKDPKGTKQPQQNDNIVVDKGGFSWSELWKKEDYWAIWLAVFLFIAGAVIFVGLGPKNVSEDIANYNTIMEQEAQLAPFKTIAWHEASDAKESISARSAQVPKAITAYLARPKGWETNPVDSLYRSEKEAAEIRAGAQDRLEQAKANLDSAYTNAKDAEAAAAAASFQNDALNAEAKAAIAQWQSAKSAHSSANSAANTQAYNLIPTLIVLMIFLALFFAIGMRFMGENVGKFIKGFTFIFALAVLAWLIEGQTAIKSAGISYVAWALILGLLISNTIGTPNWVKPAVQTEYYIKTGLVLLGASILFNKILLIGLPGIFVTWIVTPIVLITTFWFGQKVLKIESKTLNMTVSADMSVCGVSAAIATAAACKAKKEELTLAVGMSIIFTSIMMILLPMFIKFLGMHHVWGGAWIGGTVDSTGAVVAAGAFLSDQAMYVAATIKMIQNVMIGAIAFGVAWYWVAKVDNTGERVSWMEIWYRFPKFVLGFIGASLLFSGIYTILGNDLGEVYVDSAMVSAWANQFRNWFFCLAFVSIGLATNFRELAKYLKGGKPVILYICGQSFNLLLTLIVAYIMFFLVFPDITAQIMTF